MANGVKVRSKWACVVQAANVVGGWGVVRWVSGRWQGGWWVGAGVVRAAGWWQKGAAEGPVGRWRIVLSRYEGHGSGAAVSRGQAKAREPATAVFRPNWLLHARNALRGENCLLGVGIAAQCKT